jgi:pimeloyl-ACP methyl ester carboxylesterase
MQTLRVNGYDMAYLDVGQAKDGGHPLVCVHGTLGDFRTWYAVLGPLSKRHRVIAVSLRHFFPEHWDGVGDDYRIAQHVADVIAFLEQIDPKPVDLMGHSRGGHIAFRVAQQRPELLRKVVLAEPGGDFDNTLDPAIVPGARSALATRTLASLNKVRAGDIEGALQNFVDGIDGEGAWRRLPAAAKQQLATTSLPCSARCTRRASPTARPMSRRSGRRHSCSAAQRPPVRSRRCGARWPSTSPARKPQKSPARTTGCSSTTRRNFAEP